MSARQSSSSAHRATPGTLSSDDHEEEEVAKKKTDLWAWFHGILILATLAFIIAELALVIRDRGLAHKVEH